MTSKKRWNKIVWDFVHLVRSDSSTQNCTILKTDFIVLPNVFSPAKSTDTEWYAKILMPYIKEKKFLEIGAGCGAIACLGLINGAKKVVATDINPDAIKNIELNAKALNLDLDVRKGDLFEPIRDNEKFDLIFWNHPFNFYEENEDLDHLELSVFDPGYKSLEKFFKYAKDYISNDGQIFLGTSSVARIKMLKELANKYDYRMTLIAKHDVPVYKSQKKLMDLRIYSLVSI